MRHVLDAAVVRLASHPRSADLLLRGSYMLSRWLGNDRRHCDDIDLLALYPRDTERTIQHITEALRQPLPDGIDFATNEITQSEIFADSVSPGLRFSIPLQLEGHRCELQIDVAHGDPLPFAPDSFAPDSTDIVDKHPIPCPQPEVAFAWKLHGIVEFEGFAWRAKDLADLWLMQRFLELDPHRLIRAIDLAFTSRDAPFWRLDRLIEGRMGHSRRSKRAWEKYREAHPEGDYPSSLPMVVREVASFLQPLVFSLRRCSPYDEVPAPSQLECESLFAAEEIRKYRWKAAGSVYVGMSHHSRNAAPPTHAPTNAEFRRRLVLRECRGITFDCEGRLLARPYAAFEPLKNFPLQLLSEVELLEKLDGSLVFATGPADDWSLRTRRGSSEIATAAYTFAQCSHAEYHLLIQNCLEAQQTPIFEWCSRSRWIVFDHPIDRLVLTGVRNQSNGQLLPYDQLTAMGRDFRVEVIKRLTISFGNLDELVAKVRQWTDREGCVLRLMDGRQYKIKSDHYLWLHQAVEGPGQDRARWYLWAIGATEHCNIASRGRGLDLSDYFEKLDAATRQLCRSVEHSVAAFHPTTKANRRGLAAAVSDKPNLLRTLSFLAFDGKSLANEIRRIVAERCQREKEFQKLASLIGGPLWYDG